MNVRVLRSASVVAALLAVAGVACAQGSRPQVAGRLTRVFDFEEQQTNPGEVPRYWFRNQDSPQRSRPGYPNWNRTAIVYDSERAHQGEGAVNLPTQGGSTSLLLESGVLPVFADTDYRIFAHVRTSGLQHARAAIIARFIDAQGSVIAGSERVSDLTISEQQWRQITVDLTTSDPAAAFIQLELVVLQPAQQSMLEKDATAPFAIVTEDLVGSAMFDDVAILQLPRVELTTNAPAGLFTADEQPSLRMQVRDLTDETLTVRREVLAADGRVVDARSEQLASGTEAAAWTPTLPGYGWYRARMSLQNPQGLMVGGAVTDFAWLAPAAIKPAPLRARDVSQSRTTLLIDAPRLGLVFDDVPESQWSLLPHIATASGVGAMTLPLWTRDVQAAQMRDRTEMIQPIASDLVGRFVDVTLSLPQTPDELARAVNIERPDPWHVFMLPQQSGSTADDPMQRFLSDAIDRLGARAGAWQIGSSASNVPFWSSHTLPQVRSTLVRRAPGITLVVPTDVRDRWDVAELSGAAGAMRLAPRIPANMPSQAVRYAAENWVAPLAAAPRNVTTQFILDGSPGPATLPIDHAASVSRQLIETWRMLGADREVAASSPLSVALANAWHWPATSREQARPSAAVAAFAAVSQRLSDRRIVGAFPAPEGCVAWITQPLTRAEAQIGGGIIAWDESAAGDSTLVVPVANESVVMYDMFGNATRLVATRRDNNAGSLMVRVPLSRQPMFLEGLDVGLAQFVSTVEITPTLLDAAQDVGEHEIVLRNPWKNSVTGKVSVLEPGGFAKGPIDRSWRIVPRAHNFTLAAGQEVRLPMQVSFRLNQEAGPKQFVLGIEVWGDQPYGVVEIERTLDLGLKDFTLEVAATRVGDTVVAEATVTNATEAPITIELVSLAPGSPRQRATLSNLAPRAQAVRRFSYSTGESALIGERIVITATDAETNRRLSRGADVP
jgi:hypothetical protein